MGEISANSSNKTVLSAFCSPPSFRDSNHFLGSMRLRATGSIPTCCGMYTPSAAGELMSAINQEASAQKKTSEPRLAFLSWFSNAIGCS